MHNKSKCEKIWVEVTGGGGGINVSIAPDESAPQVVSILVGVKSSSANQIHDDKKLVQICRDKEGEQKK